MTGNLIAAGGLVATSKARTAQHGRCTVGQITLRATTKRNDGGVVAHLVAQTAKCRTSQESEGDHMQVKLRRAGQDSNL
jgi:hypothetical protein